MTCNPAILLSSPTIEAVATTARSAHTVILGGGPAGLASAIALCQRGIDCLVIDALVPPIDKGCGEGLMPDALESLAALGIRLRPEHGHTFRGIRFSDSRRSVDADFPHGVGLGVRRTILHELLMQRAEELGVRFAWGSHVKLVDHHSLLIDGVKIPFRFLIGADGQSSTVRRWAGLNTESRGFQRSVQRLGRRVHYNVAPWSHCVEVHWGARGQLYITPIASDCVCVVYSGRQRCPDWNTMLEQFPAVAKHLHGAAVITQPRGAISSTRTLQRVSHKNVALIGDASGSVDSVTGEGLALGFRQAVALAACIQRGDLRPYEAAHRKILRVPRQMSQSLLLMDRFPVVQRHSLRVLASAPALFQQMLAVHLGTRSISSFVLRYGPLMSLRLVTAQ